jgi:hydrogenase-1 operon protein HyaF
MEPVKQFAKIPIRVEYIEKQKPGLDRAKALITDIYSRFQALAEHDKTDVIDLRHLPPLGEDGYRLLREWFIGGEATATVKGQGKSVASESRYPGIWWVTHYNEENEIITELIEITHVPAILGSQHEDIRIAKDRFKSDLAQL